VRARLVDELRIDVMPVLLGKRTPPFDNIEPVQLENTSVQEAGARTTLGLRIRGR